MKNSAIEWTHHTFNPWQGCTKVSAGCANCYAETLSKRWGRDIWGRGKDRVRTSALYWQQPIGWDKLAAKAGERHRVFCASMADVFDPEVSPRWRNDLFELIARCKNLDWLLLTKRPDIAQGTLHHGWENVWLGVSVENQNAANERIPILMETPAVIRFVSVEPMLDYVWLHDYELDWVICGGESGPHCRPFNIEWARNLKRQCDRQEAAFFMKQLGGYPNKRHDIDEFPEDLQVRDFPKA